MKTKEKQKKLDYLCKSFRSIAPDSVTNNWPVLMMDVMKQRVSGMKDQGLEMGMDGVGFERLAVGQLPELRIRGAAQTA